MKVISLFSGAGGLDLGFEQEGFEPIIAYDIKQSAVETFNHNRKNKVARIANLGKVDDGDVVRDISSLSISDKPRGVLGGPPCQYFSNGNKSIRQDDDPRRMLPVKYAQILGKLNEKFRLDFFILENVDGLAKPKHKNDFAKIRQMFNKAGFHVTYQILDAYNFGVPQIRKRLFLVGWNKMFYPNDKYKFPMGSSSRLCVADRIGGLPEPVYFKRNLDPTKFPVHRNHWTMQPKSGKFGHPQPEEISRTPRSFRRLSWGKPSSTVAYGHNEIHVHPSGHRRLSIYEAMLLQGFPPCYELIGNLSEQVTLISDAVPPPLATALARSIKEFMIKYRYESETG